MDLVRALKFPLDDEDWPVKIAVGSLVTLIPVIGWIGSLGYQIAVARNVMRGSARPLPGSDELGQIFTDGVMAGLAGLLVRAADGALLVPDGAAVGHRGRIERRDFALACVSVLSVLLSIFYAIPAVAMYWVGAMRYSQTGNFSEFTQFGALWREVRANLGTLVSLFLYYLLLSLIFAVVSPLALITCVGIFVLAFYSQIATGHLIGQAGRQIVRSY